MDDAAEVGLTEEGMSAHRAVEEATDRAAARPWARIGPAAVEELTRELTPLARAGGAAISYSSPLGLPSPGSVR